jgi:hypothetical protein
LDRYIRWCEAGASGVHVYGYMRDVLKQTTPVMHIWPKLGPFEPAKLPGKEIDWPMAAMCLGSHEPYTLDPDWDLTISQLAVNEDLSMFTGYTWQLSGVLIFQLSATEFEVLPLITSSIKDVVFTEVQLSYKLENGEWRATFAETGPVNNTFYKVILNKVTPDKAYGYPEKLDKLVNTVTSYLAAFYTAFQANPSVNIYPAKEGKLKIRNGRIKKAYKPATVGYIEYISQ